MKLFVSCDDEETIDYTGINTVIPTATFTSSAGNGTTVTVAESTLISGEEAATITVEVSVDVPVKLSTDIILAQTGGTANGSDFTVSNITIPAFQTTGTGSITILKTGDIEGDETLEITANANIGNMISMNGSETFSFVIEDDYLTDVIGFEIGWEGSYTYDSEDPPQEVTFDFCDIDFDVAILDSALNDMGLNDAATGACPEEIDLAALPDGLYYISLVLYDNPFAVHAVNQALPVSITYNQEFFISGSFVDNSFTTDSTGGQVEVATLEITDGHVMVVTPL